MTLTKERLDELEVLIKLCEPMRTNQENFVLLESLPALLQAARLLSESENYLRHSAICRHIGNPKTTCDCGFAELAAQIEALAHPDQKP